jgi:hypothetical protein
MTEPAITRTVIAITRFLVFFNLKIRIVLSS